MTKLKWNLTDEEYKQICVCDALFHKDVHFDEIRRRNRPLLWRITGKVMGSNLRP